MTCLSFFNRHVGNQPGDVQEERVLIIQISLLLRNSRIFAGMLDDGADVFSHVSCVSSNLLSILTKLLLNSVAESKDSFLKNILFLYKHYFV